MVEIEIKETPLSKVSLIERLVINMTLDEFISEAKIDCYEVSDLYRIPTGNTELSHSYHHSGGFTFENSYVGWESFAGQETIYKGDFEKAIWSMVYTGKHNEIPTEEELKFLRLCLKTGAEQGSLRGPTTMSVNEYTYSFISIGKRVYIETLLKGGKILYECTILVNDDLI